VRLTPQGDAHLVSERNDELVIETQADAPARLVVADTLARGWTVTIDGAPASAQPGALRVVAVPAGKHTVRWRYRAPGLFAGAVISLLGLLAAAALLAPKSRKGGPQPGGPPPSF
jgi:uncharacterized membrane protein YfhO